MSLKKKNPGSLQRTVRVTVKPKLHSIHQQNCSTCVTLLYLHSNCCSPPLVCVQQKKRIISKRETRSGGQRDERDGEVRTVVQQTDAKPGERQIKPQMLLLFDVWHAADYRRKHKHQHYFLRLTKSFASVLMRPFITLLHDKCDNSAVDLTHQYLRVTLRTVDGLSTSLTMCTAPLINSVNALTIGHQTQNLIFVRNESCREEFQAADRARAAVTVCQCVSACLPRLMKVILRTWGRQMARTDSLPQTSCFKSSSLPPVWWGLTLSFHLKRPTQRGAKCSPRVLKCTAAITWLGGPVDTLWWWLGRSCAGPANGREQWREETSRQRYTLWKVGRLSCFDAQIPNKNFPPAKPLYLEGHFWLSICCHLSLHCPHSAEARRPMLGCHQKQALKQYGAGRAVIVLCVVLVDSLCVRWRRRLIWGPGCSDHKSGFWKKKTGKPMAFYVN